MSAATQIEFGASLGAWHPSDILTKLHDMAQVVDATTIYPYPWNLPLSRGTLHEIRVASRDLGLTLLVHGPCWEVYTGSVYPGVRVLGVDFIERAIDFAVAIGAVHITVHPGLNQWPDVWPHMERRALDAQAQSLVELAEYARAAGIQIGVENMPAGASSFAGYSRMTEIFRVLAMAPTLGVTLDVAHVHTVGMDPVHFIRRLGERVNHVHVTDNHADWDAHSPIGEGTIAWDSVMQALVEIGYSGVIELERSLADGGVRSSIDALRALLLQYSER